MWRFFRVSALIVGIWDVAGATPGKAFSPYSGLRSKQKAIFNSTAPGATEMLFATQPAGCCSTYPSCLPSYGLALGGLCPSPSCCSLCTCPVACPMARGLPAASAGFFNTGLFVHRPWIRLLCRKQEKETARKNHVLSIGCGGEGCFRNCARNEIALSWLRRSMLPPPLNPTKVGGDPRTLFSSN